MLKKSTSTISMSYFNSFEPFSLWFPATMTHFDFLVDIQFWIDLFQFLFMPLFMVVDYFCSFYRLFVPKPLKSLESDVILITGAASGIGREVCHQLLAAGVKSLVLWDINSEENEKLAKCLRNIAATKKKNNGVQTSIHSYKVDVADRENVSETAEKMRRDQIHVTILFNNAGIATISDFFDAHPHQLERTVNVNMLAHFWLLRAFLPPMISRGRGQVVTNCSMLGLIGVTKGVAYCASKFGVRGYLEALESEIRHMPSKPDIKFTTVYPFFVDTPMVNHLKVEYRLSVLFKNLDCPTVGGIIVKAIRQESHHVHIPWHQSFLIALQQVVCQDSIHRIMDFFIKDIKYYPKKQQQILLPDDNDDTVVVSKKLVKQSQLISFQKNLDNEMRSPLTSVASI